MKPPAEGFVLPNSIPDGTLGLDEHEEWKVRIGGARSGTRPTTIWKLNSAFGRFDSSTLNPCQSGMNPA